MNNIYLIYGNDYGLIKREIDKITNNIIDVIKYDLSMDKVDNLLDDALCISMFEDKKVLIGENCLFLTGKQSSNIDNNFNYLSSYLNDDNHQNIVIFTVLSDKLDERKKIVKQLKSKANVIYKESISDKDLPNFVINEFKNNSYFINYQTANYFVDYVGKNVDIILSEIEKMIIYKEEDKQITKEDINNISSKKLDDNIFDLSDAIMKKNFKKIFSCYEDLMICNEDAIRIISMLGNQFNLVYLCKILDSKGKNQKEISSVLMVHPYRVKLALEADYMMYELEDIIKKLHNLDYEIKSGKLDKNIGLSNFLMHI